MSALAFLQHFARKKPASEMKSIVCTVSGRYMEKFMKSNLPIIGKILAVVISVLCIAFMAILHFSDKVLNNSSTLNIQHSTFFSPPNPPMGGLPTPL